jgi:lysophospholipase L1-like esterase
VSEYRVQRKDIVLIGDSLTEFFNWQGRFPGHRVLNLGIAGEPVEGLLGRVSGMHDAIAPADLIFVMTGINNIAMGDYDIIPKYEKILNTIISDSTNAEVVIQSILPVRLSWLANAEIERIDSGLEQIARKMDILYFDLYSLFVDAGGKPIAEYLSEGGVHLSDRGYEVWSDAIEKEFSL